MLKITAHFFRHSLALFSIAALAAAPMGLAASNHGHHGHDHAAQKTAPAIPQLVALMIPTMGNKVHGSVLFTDLGDGKVEVLAKLQGLPANSTHAMHIHEFGDIRSHDGMHTGGHYNPEGHEHGLPDQAHRHAGDFGNLTSDAEGKVEFRIVVDNLTLMGTHNPIVGRGVIVHAGPDDGSQPVGNAGARISQGVIGVAKH